MVTNHLRFNVGYLLESPPGTRSEIEVDYPQVRVGDVHFKNLSGKFQAIRTSEGIFFTGQFETFTGGTCVRCLDDLFIPNKMEMEELYYYPASTAPNGEYVVGGDGNADLGPLLRELSVLGLPMQPICRSDCQGLCMECGQNLNEADCGCEANDIDPRMAVLQKLMEQQNDEG